VVHEVGLSSVVERQGAATVAIVGLGRVSWRVMRWYFGALALTVAISGAMVYLRVAHGNDYLFGTARLFDPRFEANVPTWLNTVVLFSAAVVALLIGFGSRRVRDASWPRWLILGVGFLYLSMDEAAEVHEMTIRFLPKTFVGFSVPPHAWAIFGVAAAGLVGLYFLPFLRSLPSRIRLYFIAGGVVYLMGGAGFELAQGVMMSSGVKQLSGPYLSMALAEETLEVGGILIFLAGALSFLCSRIVHVAWSATPEQPSSVTVSRKSG
jgi:hypothetical protein